MRVTLLAAMSVDGKIAESEDQVSLDWTSKEDTKFFVAKTKEIGVVIMGRKTFETIGHPLPGRLTIVMTRNAKDFADKNVPGSLEFTAAHPQDILTDLERRDYSWVALAGGKSVYSRFFQESLVTDVYLTIEPVIFGGGVPLVEGFDRVEMTLDDVTRLGDKAVLLHYEV